MREHTLVVSLAAQPDPPCVQHQCPMVARCASELLACDAMHLYVLTARVWHPCVIVHRRTPRGKNAFAGMREQPEPTAEIYRRTFPKTDPPDERRSAAKAPLVCVGPEGPAS